MTPEERAHQTIDQLLAADGRAVQDFKGAGVTEAEKQGATPKGVQMPIALTQSPIIE